MIKVKFKEEIKKAKEKYFSWGNEIFCLALNENIKITRVAWDHIFKEKVRSKEQLFFRAKNFILAKKLIKKINLPQNHTIKYKKNGDIKFWILQGIINKKIILVVIRQIGNQKKHFYSLVYKGSVPQKKD